MRRLVGVGVGPGDPELVTVKAVRMLRGADLVLVPVLADDLPGRAEATVRAHVDHDRVRRVVFTLDHHAWAAAAGTVAAAFADGAGTVAFATIGDPNVYSTFSYLAEAVHELVDDVVVETVPGITAMQDLAARSGTPLVEGSETLALLPLTAGLDVLRAALATHDTVVAYKGGRRIGEVLDVVRASGRLDEAVYGAALGLPEQEVRPAADVGPDAPYLSTLLIPPRRGWRGGPR